MPARICCATVVRRTWSKAAPTCGRCRPSSGMPTSPPRRCIRTWLSTGSRMCTASIIRGRKSTTEAQRHRVGPVHKAVARFLRSLRERNASAHTIKAYTGDLEKFAAYVGEAGWKQIDHVRIRGFLSQLYDQGLSKTSVARALAAVRSLYRWLAREGVVEQNPAALVSTPRLPKKLPRVPTIEEMNTLLDGAMPELAA